MVFYKFLFQDVLVNKNNPKAIIVLVMFRTAQFFKKSILPVRIMFIPYFIFYRICIEWILGVEIPYKTQIGPNLMLFHGQSLVINDNTIIGANCVLRHCTTIGNKKLADGSYSNSPIIGDNVDIGSNVVIIGPITIGNNVQIGAGSVVVRNIPDGSKAVGNPARILKL
jgi:putative colanic acid biosynthesis acetyltransferase WcaB